MLPLNVVRYGRRQDLPEARRLRAGPLSMTWQDGWLRDLRMGDVPVLQAIYATVRDSGWGTVLPTIKDIHWDVADGSFYVSFAACHQQGEIVFSWRGEIEGSDSGIVRFSMDGEARCAFLTNRIGIAVLHPLSAAGARSLCEHTDGGQEDGVMPVPISPHQPFMDLRAFSHEVSPGVWARVAYEGDVFEMEDQRNWTDASFKTYCPPLGLPFPVRVEAGQRVNQSVTLTLEGPLPKASGAQREPVVALRPLARLHDRARRIPQVGLSVASDGQTLSERQTDRLTAMELHHLRVGLVMARDDWRQRLRSADSEAKRLGLALEVAVFLGDDADAQLDMLSLAAATLGVPVYAWLVLRGGIVLVADATLRSARDQLKAATPTALMAAGSHTHYTELNRGWPDLRPLDAVCLGLTPQMHAFDNLSMIETTATQAVVLSDCREKTDGLPALVGPITLRLRSDPTTIDDTSQVAHAHGDERQMSLFAAAWTVASLKYLSEGGAYAATYFETAGPLGVQGKPENAHTLTPFSAMADTVYPLYHVLADAGEWQESLAIPVVSSAPLRVVALCLESDHRRTVLLANLTNDEQRVRLSGLGTRARGRWLDETTFWQACFEPELYRGQAWQDVDLDADLALLPYAVVRLDIEQVGRSSACGQPDRHGR